jgi:hypothetical protein
MCGSLFRLLQITRHHHIINSFIQWSGLELSIHMLHSEGVACYKEENVMGLSKEKRKFGTISHRQIFPQYSPCGNRSETW